MAAALARLPGCGIRVQDIPQRKLQGGSSGWGNLKAVTVRCAGGGNVNGAAAVRVEEQSIPLPIPLPLPLPLPMQLNPSPGAELVPLERKEIIQVELPKSGISDVDVDVLNHLRHGRLVEANAVYRQTFVVRSYEVGADKTVSIDALNNLFQDVALNHVWVSGLAGDGFGATHAMVRGNLIWVVTRMHVQVDRYPAWGDVIEIDSWVGASGKNGMRRDWLVRDYKSGQILARATSTWVMMNKVTRRLSKMPQDVRDEISPWFIDRTAMAEQEAAGSKISKLDDASAGCIRSNLMPKRSDLDMNQHVNNVKYIGWMMESLPVPLMESHELATIILEYRKECGQWDTVQALSSREASDEDDDADAEAEACTFSPPVQHDELGSCNRDCTCDRPQAGEDSCTPSSLSYTHLIRTEADSSEILRGRTIWRRKQSQFRSPAH